MRGPRLKRAGARASSPVAAPALRRAAEEASSRIPELMTAAERVAATVAQGVHGRRRVGRGDAFWQFRPYQPGDSAQAIDWRQTAKSTRAFVRESEWEAAQSVWIWCDRSPSMRFGSDARWPEKRDRAAVLTLALTLLLVRGGERVAALGSRAAPGGGRAVVDRIAGALLRPDGAGESLPALEALPRHARLVLIGDMLAPVPETARFVRETAAMGVDGYILQIVDPAEAALPYRGRVRFDGTEDEGRVTIGRVESVRADYLAALGAHRAALAALARSVRWGCAVHVTDTPPQTALLALHAALGDGRGLHASPLAGGRSGGG